MRDIEEEGEYDDSLMRREFEKEERRGRKKKSNRGIIKED